MKTFSKNQIRIIGLMIFIIILLLVLYLKKTVSKPNLSVLDSEYKEKFSEGDDNKCGTVPLIRTQYGDTNNDNKLPFKLTEDKYIYLIEDVQPFEPPQFLNRRDERNYTDTILEIKQSRNYIWCLNEGRDRLVYSPNNNLNKKKFRDVFKKQNLITKKQDNQLEVNHSYYITAFGVHKSYCANEEWCAVSLKNISELSILNNNKLIFFRPSSIKEKYLNMDSKKSDYDGEGILIKESDFNLEGNIIIKKISDKEYNLFSIVYDENFIGKVQKIRVDLVSKSIKFIDTFMSDNSGVLDASGINLPSETIKDSIIYIEKIKYLLKEGSYPRIKRDKIQNSEIYSNLNDLKVELSITQVDDGSERGIFQEILYQEYPNDEVKLFLEKEILDDWKDKFEDVRETKFDKILTKFLNRLINKLLTYKLTLGYCDIFEFYDKSENTNILHLSKTKVIELANKQEIEISRIKINENDESTYSFDGDIEEEILISKLEMIFNSAFNLNEGNKYYKNSIIGSEFSPKEIKFLRTDSKIPNLDETYELSEGTIDIYNNVVGILNYKNNNSQDNLIKEANIFHKRDVIFTVYQEVTKVGDSGKNFYAIYNKNNTAQISSMIIPGIKFNYDGGLSLLNFFKMNVDAKDKDKFSGYYDWIYLFDNLRNEGFYDFSDKVKYNNQILTIQNSFKNNNELSGDNYYRFTNKHKKILEKDLKNVFKGSSSVKNYLNFHISIINKKYDENTYKVNLLFDLKDETNEEEIDKDEICKKRKYLGIDKTKEKEFKDVKNYVEYSFINKLESEYEKLEDSTEKSKYEFKQEKVNSFNDFKKLVYYTESDDEKLFDRQRLRGLLELDEKYVDFEYIDYLKEIRKNTPKYQLKFLDQVITQKEKIARKYTIKEKVFNINGEHITKQGGENEERLVNKLGYPFYVIYTEKDYYGNPCSSEETKKQKIFLTNRIIDNMIYTNKIEKEYPFIKQEFLSFTGYGNMIQFYEKKYGGSTEIETPNLCSQEDVSFIDDCDTQLEDGGSSECVKKKLTEVYLDGTAKCEINDPTVKRKGETGSEVLFLKSIDVNACNIYMMKGNVRQYFKLGKIFRMNGDVKYQEPKQFTIQTENDDYLVYRDEIIKKVYEDPNASGEISDEFIFELTVDTDIYGIYFLFSPKLASSSYLTRKVNIFNNSIIKDENEEFKLEPRLFEKDDITSVPNKRNKLQAEEYNKDIEYYSQKFIVPLALATNIAAEDGISIDAIDKELESKRKQQQVQADFFPGLVRGTPDNLEISLEEEVSLIERNLAYLNKYLSDLNKLPPVQVDLIPNLLDNFKFIQKEGVKARKLMIERLENIKFLTRVSETAKNQESIYNVSGPVKISNDNNNSNNTNMESRFSEFQIQESANAINKIKKQFKSKQKYQPKCYQLEGFANIPEHYKDRTSENNNNLVDKYYDYINAELKEKETNLNKSTNDIQEILNNIKAISDISNNNTNINKLKLSQEVNLKNKVDRDVFLVKEYSQKEEMKEINKKIQEIQQIKDEIDKKEDKCKLPFEKRQFNYHSIISKEDGSLLNTYRLKDNERNKSTENELSRDLDKNIIFVNGGCLSYDEENGDLKSEHCMIGDKNQTFNIHKLEDEDDMKRFKLKNPQNEEYRYDRNNNKKILERPFYIISKLNEDGNTDDENCTGQLNKNKCLHNDNGKLSMRNCENIINQKWEYSNVSGPCK